MRKRLKIAFISSIIVVLFIVLGSIAYLNGLSGLHNNGKVDNGKIKVACVGDSITYGHGVAMWPQNHYPAQLQQILGDKYCVFNFGVSGSTAQSDGDKPYVETKSYTESIAFDADIVVIMLGTNDAKPQNWKDLSTFLSKYKALIDSYKQNNNDVKIYVCSPATAFFQKDGQKDGPAAFDIQPNIVKGIAESISEFCSKNGYLYIDMYNNVADKQLFLNDGIHPNKAGAAVIAQIVASSITK